MVKTASSGLDWCKLDLHVHTPASTDYSGSVLTPKEFVDKAISQGVDGIAITDHNTAAWVDDVIAAANGTTLAVFPGVEVTASAGDGVHIIALFDRDQTAKTVESLLANVKIPPSDYGKTEATSPLAPMAVIETIVDLGGLAILAHADSSRGALKVMKGKPRTMVVQCPHLAAVEVVNYAKTAPFLDGSDPEYKRKLPVYRSSDNPNSAKKTGHSVEGIGSRFTWFKVDGISLDALAQCFRDPDVRIVPDILSEENPGTSCPFIASLEASQGFLEGQSFRFHQGLNAIIGGAGVGKSLVVEFIRFALNQHSPIDKFAADMNGKVHARLGLGGEVTLTITTAPQTSLQVRRIYDGVDNPITVSRTDSGEVVQGAIGEIFPVLAYSQTEALAIAEDPRAQLHLIDSFLETAHLTGRAAELRNALRSSDHQIAKAIKAAGDLESLEQSLSTAREKLSQIDLALKSGQHDEILALEPTTHFLSSLQDSVDDFESVSEEFQDQLAEIDTPVPPPALKDDTMLATLVKKLSKLQRDLAGKASESAKLVTALSKAVNTASSKWQKHVDTATHEYTEWAKAQGGNRSQLTAKRKTINADITKLERRLKKVKKEAERIDSLRAVRGTDLDDLEALEQETFDLRLAKYESIANATNGSLRLGLERHGDRAAYCETLTYLKTGSNLHEATIRAIADKVTPRDLVAYVLDEDGGSLAKASGINEKQANKFVQVLGSREALDEVLALEHSPLREDQPGILFRKDDGSYHALSELSVGQKCVALLIIALVEGDCPVIIDQPEDALDTASVYEDITLRLRTEKGRRQFILTTHNSTVAVASDSDDFHVLTATADSGTLTTSGAMDRPVVKEAVIQHLEGGEIPLALKISKYSPRFTRPS